MWTTVQIWFIDKKHLSVTPLYTFLNRSSSRYFRGHSTTIWIKFYPFWPSTPLEWTIVDIHTTFLIIWPTWTTYLKPNYFKEQRSSSSFLLTWSRYTGSKWSTWQPSSTHFRHGLLRLHGHFEPIYLLHVSKNDDEEQPCFLK